MLKFRDKISMVFAYKPVSGKVAYKFPTTTSCTRVQPVWSWYKSYEGKYVQRWRRNGLENRDEYIKDGLVFQWPDLLTIVGELDP